jgi:large subunit ribosomal protein L25
MEKIVLEAELRGTGRHQVHEMRASGRVPAVVYGPGAQPKTVAVDARALHKALVSAGSGLITLKVGSTPAVQVLTREIQRDPVRRNIIHIDFQAVSMTQKLRLDVPVEPEGVAPATVNSDLVLVRVLNTVEIECLPADIPAHLVADLSKLETVDDEVVARDLVLPAGVRLVTDPEQVIFAITISRATAEEEAAAEGAEEASADTVEVIAKGKAAKAEEDF